MCSVGLSPQQQALTACLLQLTSVWTRSGVTPCPSAHLHPNQKGRREDPGSEGPKGEQRVGEMNFWGEEAEMRDHIGSIGQLYGKGGQDSRRRHQGRRLPLPVTTFPFFSQTPSLGAEENLPLSGMRA